LSATNVDSSVRFFCSRAMSFLSRFVRKKAKLNVEGA